ncbi:GNAT family N-acetyltransferase [Paenibacillus polymyxa]|nr:GNAT family N-acetyltransferase [Paenibacillus polymyxa]
MATEAVQRLLQFGFDDLHLGRVEARCYEANVSSERVLNKIGMSYERSLPSFELHDEDEEASESLMDVKVYSMNREQYISPLQEKDLKTLVSDKPQ